MEIKLGYEIPTGKEIAVPVRHMCVTGQTQAAGKTSTLEALINRSGLRAIAFLTKRGEGSFSIGRQIKPYFKDAANWQFVESIIEASLKEKNKFQRAWIQKACLGAKTLADVHRNTQRLRKDSKRSMDQDQYMLLSSYFDIVVPQIAKLPKSPTLTLGPGLNVMDLTMFEVEMQMLIVRSVIEWVHKHETKVITIIPEAWKMVPEGKGSPVKSAAESLVREGAGLHNFVWLDSQDIAGVSKILLRACTVWIIGVQREANEIKRTIGNIPAGLKQPKAADVATLGIGQFYACFDAEIHKTYVQPLWMTDDQARDVAIGKVRAFGPAAKPTAPIIPFVSPAPISTFPIAKRASKAGLWNTVKTTLVLPTPTKDDDMDATVALNEIKDLLRQAIGQRSMDPMDIQRRIGVPVAMPTAIAEDDNSFQLPADEETMYQRFKQRLIAEAPSIIQTIQDVPEIHVKEERVVIEADKSIKGRLALLISEGFFNEGAASVLACKEFTKRGWTYANINMGIALKDLTTAGALTKTDKLYTKVAGIKIIKK